MSNPPNPPLMPLQTPAQTNHKPFNKTRLAVLLGSGMLAAGIVATVGFSSASSEPAPPKLLVPGQTELHVTAPATAAEGQPFDVRLGWRNLPAAAHVSPQALSLRWQDTSYTGEAIKPVRTLNLGQNHARESLIFESPGAHRVEVLGPDGAVWKTLQVNVEPFKASVYPARWEQFRVLPQDPGRYHIYVNLHYDAKNPKSSQRQYLQITQDGQILERLLVSSGALSHMTPLGKFKLGFKDYYPRSAKYNNTPMPFWSAIEVPGHPGEFGFHSLEDGGYHYLLGRPASHGCIRMSRLPSVEKDPKTGQPIWGDRGGARWIYDRIPKGTAITLFKRPLPAFVFEDYERWQVRTAREAQAAYKAKLALKAEAKTAAKNSAQTSSQSTVSAAR